MAEIKVKKILEAGKVIYPATILDAVKDSKSVINNGANPNYGKTLREILDSKTEEANIIKGRLDVIEGEGEGSIKKSVSDAIANVVANAPEAFDTLKEIADWITKQDNTTAVGLVASVEANTAAIGVESKPETSEGAGDAVVATGIYKRLEDLEARDFSVADLSDPEAAAVNYDDVF